MSYLNRVIVMGYLGNDPEVRTMPDGEYVANISVATTESWLDKKTGERRELVEWHRIVFYRRQAEIVKDYLHKGSHVYIEGKIRTRRWQDPQTGEERSAKEILGDVLKMLDRNPNTQASHQEQQPRPPEPPLDHIDDEIPFAPIHHGYSKHSVYVV